jgi:hypothetical protein
VWIAVDGLPHTDTASNTNQETISQVKKIKQKLKIMNHNKNFMISK